MELTVEAYRNILKNVESRADIATLCRVSRGFQRVAERELYNTLFMRNDEETMTLCRTLTTSSHLAVHVGTLTIDLSEEDNNGSDSDADVIQDQPPPPRAMDWAAVAGALQMTTRLRSLNVHINDGSTTSTAWVLDGCTFQLRRFHCDLDWDLKLVAFLESQTELEDLYILDYHGQEDSNIPTPSEPTPQVLHLGAHAIQRLSVLECTFSEAAMALVPGRPITHLKTCFSQTEPIAKREEMRSLLLNVGLSIQALRSIDIGDSSYSESFSSELLAAIANMGSLATELRHIGTLVLPIEGPERLRFYGQLKRLPNIQSVELEVTEWDPPPSTPAALRALASEVRLYKPSVVQIIFMQNFDRTVVTALGGICRVDLETNIDLLWREK